MSFHKTAASRLQQVASHLSTSSPSSPSSSSSPSISPDKPFKVTVIGSGNWGTTIAKIIAENTALTPNLFQRNVNMWVYEEKINGKNLTEIINTKHENVKYLPDIKLPENLIAQPDIAVAVKDSDLIVFNIPHQFLKRICSNLKGHIKPTARAISCLKGLNVNPDGCQLLSDYITDHLGIHCGALSGANLAPEIARHKWSETTVAYNLPNDYRGPTKDINQLTLKKLFHRPYFHVRVIDDIAGVSLAGALKNIVALAAGFVEGLGWGDNAKAAIMRIGLMETVNFGKTFFPNCNEKTFTEESAGVADLITTCSGGRNVKIGKYMAETGKSAWDSEKDLLNGQSAQGIITAKEVHELLENKNMTADFPLFEATYQIVYGSESMQKLPELLERCEQ
ncbi:glycerol-3-phosphate dehydrogenase (NAD(+)) GPD1 [Ascoidea rubescens DSM 1968]|uniref:Glycerol-3-phosphate dehydrogenase [NAD(+)] n=1 Tax=Ascoidea rubescens DSM 1968 TaxID=1344418 RepID=A0A1D2VIA2_9ASCO|nr:NAD-dependent glycerol-3-phosphate dehydrogenase [Ascoidea rubescens DSM 1968]ODV61203.1 NAD-dependent glycerol-3-phosphate dehydrogenase [Ascoidea rubescens DSM 1968]